MNNTLNVSEKFYSIQGEGITSGVPAYFIRLANCNLSCGATPSFVNQFKKDEVSYDPGSFKGDLHAIGQATWTCDTIPVWAKGKPVEFNQIISDWILEGIEEDVRNGTIHIVWTGGEPTIPIHQIGIVNFLDNYNDFNILKGVPISMVRPFNEIETNGTIVISDELMVRLDQINCSPKLSNSGMSESKRIVPVAIKQIMTHSNYQFKFVISSEEDIKEMFRDFIRPFNIPLKNVVCMPGLDDQNDFFERTAFVMEMAKKYKFIGLTRLHVAAWDKVTGV